MSEITLKVVKKVNTQVLVVGGGVSGVCAAIAAARLGKDVIIMEDTGVLGGQATLGQVGPIASLTAHDNKSFGGIMQELMDAAREAGKAYGGIDDNGYLSNPHMLRFVLLEKADDAGVRIFFHTRLIAADRDGKNLTRVYGLTKSGIYAFQADTFIDASGDADLVALSGEDYAFGSEPGVMRELMEAGMSKMHFENTEYKPREDSGAVQPVSIMFTIGGVIDKDCQSYTNKRYTYSDMGITREDYEKFPYSGKVGFEENGDLLPLPQGRFLFFNGARPGEYIVNMSRVTGINGTDAESLNRGEICAQEQVLPIIDLLKRFIPGFENCYLINAAMTLGIRESRRLKGRHVLSGSEVLWCKEQEDAIARGSYIIDIHDPYGKSKAIGGEIKGNAYDVPYASLLPVHTDNLLVCGRCISADHVAHSSSRIQGTCMLTGQAAGTAAAMAINAGITPAELDAAELRKQLKRDGMDL